MSLLGKVTRKRDGKQNLLKNRHKKPFKAKYLRGK